MMPELRSEAKELVEKVKNFINDEVKPKEHIFHDQIKVGEDRWNSYPAVIDELKEKARSAAFGIYFYQKVSLVLDSLTMSMLI